MHRIIHRTVQGSWVFLTDEDGVLEISLDPHASAPVRMTQASARALRDHLLKWWPNDDSLGEFLSELDVSEHDAAIAVNEWHERRKQIASTLQLRVLQPHDVVRDGHEPMLVKVNRADLTPDVWHVGRLICDLGGRNGRWFQIPGVHTAINGENITASKPLPVPNEAEVHGV